MTPSTPIPMERTHPRTFAVVQIVHRRMSQPCGSERRADLETLVNHLFDRAASGDDISVMERDGFLTALSKPRRRRAA